MLQAMQSRPTISSALKSNWLFILCFCIWIIIGGILLLNIFQGDAILFFNDHHTPFWDFFFKYGTRFAEEYVFISVAILLAVFVRFRTALGFLFMALATLIVSSATKSLFGHPRPFQFFTDLGIYDNLNLVEGVRVNVGKGNSFPSGHTIAGFAIYAFLAFNSKYKHISGLVFFSFAMMVGLSRIYLVQHFLKDVYLGSVIGLLIALYFYLLQYKLGKKPWLDRNLLNLRKVSA